ncbi:hypothetical protein KA005_67840, partial [bacterium]|nr:hypothetical protein [bacterium]
VAKDIVDTMRTLIQGVAKQRLEDAKLERRANVPVITEDLNSIKIEKAPEITEDRSGEEYIIEQFTKVGEESDNFMFSNIHAGKPSYDFITANDTVTDENGKPIEGAYTRTSKVRSAAQNFVGRHDIGDLTLNYNVGINHAKKVIQDLIRLSASGVSQERLHYSVSGSVLQTLESDAAFKQEIEVTTTIRELLSGLTMLDVIKDSQTKVIEGKSVTLVHMMPFGRVSFLGLTRLNLAHVSKESPDDPRSIADAIKPVAYAMSLISNNLDRINEIETFLKQQSQRDLNFYKKVFEIALPPIAKLNYEVIKQSFDAEAEVLRAL